MEKEELYARIEELEKELAEERIRRKITEDNSDCALWEYEIATKKYVLSRKLGRKWSTTNMVIENYQEQMHKWGFVHPDDWSVFDAFCEAMDRGDEHISYEVRQVSDEAVFVWFRYVGIPVYDKDHKPYKIMGKTLDITGEKKNQELLEQKAERDSLTDLYNKAKMHKLVEKHIQQEDMQEGAFLIIDIDDFKSINDTYGHLYGDEVLIKIANAILISAGMEDYAGRIGGDEFCVFCRGENAGQHAMETAERISRMADRIHLSGRRVTLSMGISRYPEDASSYEELYQKADQALYRVKRSGKNAFSVYDKNYNYVDYTSDRKETDRETGIWQELEKYYKGRQWTEAESEILSTMTRMMESYLNREEGAGIVREQEKDTEKPEPVIAGTETPESFSAKLEQILPWQDGQYAGHTINNKFARQMRKEIRLHEIQAPTYDCNREPIMDVNRIRELLPHRYPMQLVDKVIEIGANYIVGVKNVTSNEPFFQGHFPQEPVMPGVLQIEAMAQTGGLLVLNSVDEPERYSTYFMKIDGVKFRQKVVPGDTLIFRVELMACRRKPAAAKRRLLASACYSKLMRRYFKPRL